MIKGLFSKKLRVLTIVLGILIVVGAAALIGGKLYTDAKTASFDKEGYVINVTPQAESYTYDFSTGEKYSKNFSGDYQFTDAKGNDVTIEPDSFLFYNDNTFAALSKGVVLNIPDVSSNQFINNYSIQPMMEVAADSAGYSIENNDDAVQLSEVLWKISDTKYIVLSSSLNVNFGEGDVRETSDFVEFNYIDEGVVQIITKDNVWQTVSPEVAIETAAGGKINLVDQIVEYDGVQMLLSKLVVDSDSNIELSPLETKSQIVPEFNIEGENGDSGAGGNSGNSGENGNKAANGYNGNKGNDGDDGDLGGDGDDGNDGEDGEDSTHDSTFTTAIPQVSLAEWKVTATGVTGKYSVEDKNGMMSSNLQIQIFEAGTGEKIDCIDDASSTGNFDPYTETEFKNANKLKPDTEYRLVISGSYDMNGVTNSREFMSKVFYTDSLGVFIEKQSVDTTSIEVNVTMKDYSAADVLHVYLLTEEEAKKMSESVDGNFSYTKVLDIDVTPKEEKEETVKFEKLTSNTNYVVRIVSEIDNQKYLSQQAINATTLKIAPLLGGTPTVVSNRASWAFELFGGSALDPDDAIISYVYDVYDKSGNVVRSLDVTPSKANAGTYLYIDGKSIVSGEEYTFKVTALYNDNEKIVELESASSNPFVLYGSQLPAVTFRPATLEGGAEAVTANRIQGELVISLNGSKIDVDTLSQHPITITMTCEGTYEKTIKISDKTQLKSYNADELIYTIDEQGLNQNKLYRFDVTSYVDVGDGFPTDRSLGHVVQATRSLTKLDAVWADTTNTTNAFSMNLHFVSADSSTELSDSVDAKVLDRVVLRLYDGQDTTKLLGERVFTDEDSSLEGSTLTEQFIDGQVEITEETFGIESGELTGNSYIIRVNNVYDYTVSTDATTYTNAEGKTVSANIDGYTNEFTVTAATKDKVVTKSAQVPSLPTMDKLDSQIRATAIYNSDAATYGQTVNKMLPDNAIIGYTINFAFNNSSRLARGVDLYAFKTEDFDGKTESIYEFGSGDKKGSLKSKDDNNKIVTQKYLTVSEASYSMPKIAIIFGEGNDGTVINGNTILYSSDMERGHKYSFAYAVEYVSEETMTNADSIYPYDHKNFKDFSVDEQNNYVLQSTPQDTPKVSPTYYMYAYKESDSKLQMRYLYIDYDKSLLAKTNVYSSNPENGNQVATQMDMDNPYPNDTTAVGNYWNDMEISTAGLGDTINRYFEWYPYEFDPNASYASGDYRQTKKYAQGVCTYDNGEKLSKDQIDKLIDDKEISLEYNYDNLDKNFLELKLNCPDDLYKKLTNVELTATATDPNTNKVYTRVISVSITSDSHSYSLSLSNFAALIGHGDITITSKIYYDSGNQGWAYAENTSNDNNPLFALSSLNSETRGHYLVYNSATNSVAVRTSNTMAMGSMFSTNYMNALPSNGNLLTSEALATINPFKSSKLTIYPIMAGVNYKTTYNLSVNQSLLSLVDTTNAANNIQAVPKEIKAANIGEEKTSQITSIVPSVAVQEYHGYTNYVSLSNMSIYGHEGIDEIENTETHETERIVNLKVYNTKNELIDTIKLDLNKLTDAYPDNDTLFTLEEVMIKNLEKNTEYILRASAMVGGKEKNLLNTWSNNGSEWYMKILTSSKVEASSPTVEPVFTNYYNKYLDVKYTLSQVTGFKVQYSILNEAGDVVLSPDEITSTTSPLMYTTSMVDQIPIKMGWIGDKLFYDTNYTLRIQLAQTDADGNLMKDESGNQIYIGDDLDVGFMLQQASDPVVFEQMWVDSGSSTDMELNMQFSVTDNHKVIMADEGDPTAYYYARLYKIVDGKKEDVTPDEMKSAHLAAGTSYSFTKENIGTSESYQLVFYSALDKNYDGIEDDLDTLEKASITSLSNSQFEDNKDKLVFFERAVYQTPDTNGIVLGDQSFGVSANDNTMVAVTYKNAVNINRIDRVEYSMTDEKGSTTTGVITNSADYPVFVYRTGGYYTLELPSKLKDKGKYNITLRYMIYDSASDSYKEQSRYSDIYVY